MLRRLNARLGHTAQIKPSPAAVAAHDPDRDLWSRDRQACCDPRKVAPLAAELASFDAWLNGRRRCHGGERSALESMRLKFNPLARTTPAELKTVFDEAGLARYPLERLGFKSVGCIPCTARVLPGESVRAGRWRRGRGDRMRHSHQPASAVAER